MCVRESDPRHEQTPGAGREFERQVENLLRKGYPAQAGLTEDEFLARVMPLATALPTNGTRGGVFALVVRSGLVSRHEAMGLVELSGRWGFTEMEAGDLARFADLPEIALPSGSTYLVTGIATGRDTLNLTPDTALERIGAVGRSPLTIDEGIAVVTHHPDVLEAENSFSLLGSRCGDRRVTAIWLSKRRPRLGWCWAGNPHTWLGSASCASRVGA